MPQNHTFELNDGQGQAHRYTCALHPPSRDGVALALDLAALGLEPVARLAQGVLKDAKVESVQALLDDKTLFERLDLAKVGADLRAALLMPQAATLPRRLLSNTTRDGKDLGTDFAFDEAYAGNYLELAKALWEVVRANRFLPLPGI